MTYSDVESRNPFPVVLPYRFPHERNFVLTREVNYDERIGYEEENAEEILIKCTGWEGGRGGGRGKRVGNMSMIRVA